MWWKFDQWPGLCCKEVHCSQAEVRAVLAAAACHEKQGGSSCKMSVPEESYVGTISFLIRVLEAHRQGRVTLLWDIFMAMCVLSILTCERQSSSFPLPLSTSWSSPRQQWRKTCISVGAGSRSLGTAESAKKTCGQLVKTILLQIVLVGIAFSFLTVGRSTKNNFFPKKASS